MEREQERVVHAAELQESSNFALETRQNANLRNHKEG